MPAAPTQKQERAIVELLKGKTQQEVADAVGINRRTLVRWLNDENFQQALQESRFGIAQATLNSLVELSEDAIAVLRGILAGTEASTARARIALDVVRLTIDRVEFAQVQKRLNQLEEKLGNAAS